MHIHTHTHTYSPTHAHICMCAWVYGVSLVAKWLKTPPANLGDMDSLSQEESLQKKMATNSSILACKISWTEEPGGLQSMGSQKVGYDLATKK